MDPFTDPLNSLINDSENTLFYIVSNVDTEQETITNRNNAGVSDANIYQEITLNPNDMNRFYEMFTSGNQRARRNGGRLQSLPEILEELDQNSGIASEAQSSSRVHQHSANTTNQNNENVESAQFETLNIEEIDQIGREVRNHKTAELSIKNRELKKLREAKAGINKTKQSPGKNNTPLSFRRENNNESNNLRREIDRFTLNKIDEVGKEIRQDKTLKLSDKNQRLKALRELQSAVKSANKPR